MLKPVLPPACYTEDHWFKLEQEKIFSKLWLLAGVTQQLRDDDSFINRDFSGTPVLIQNIGGELRAFRNACTHRGVPIQIAEHGKRKMICPYLGWSFGKEGNLRGIPNPKLYDISETEKASAHLHRYALEVVGNFIFVNLSDNPLPISEQFPDAVLKMLKDISTVFSSEVSYTHFTGEYNWKLNYENILDWNHIQFVHDHTFSPLLDYEKNGELNRATPDRDSVFGRHIPPPHPLGTDLKALTFLDRMSLPYKEPWFAEYFAPPIDPGGLLVCHMFPNVNFGSIHGLHYYLQQYVPIAPDRIEYHSWVFHTRLKPSLPPMPHLLWGIHHAEKRVVDEDIVIFKALQKALKSASKIGIMGDYELPLTTLGNWYMQHLTEDSRS